MKEKYNLNDLKREVKNLGEDNLIAPLYKDSLCWFKNSMPNTVASIENMLAKTDFRKPYDKRWADNLKRLRDKIYSFEDSENLSKIERDRYISKFALDCAMILEELVKGYVSIKDDYCPACPDAKNKSWEKWNKLISPLNYLNLCSRQVYEKDEKGIDTPINLNIK